MMRKILLFAFGLIGLVQVHLCAQNPILPLKPLAYHTCADHLTSNAPNSTVESGRTHITMPRQRFAFFCRLEVGHKLNWDAGADELFVPSLGLTHQQPALSFGPRLNF